MINRRRSHTPMKILLAGLPTTVSVAIACEALNRGHYITVTSAREVAIETWKAAAAGPVDRRRLFLEQLARHDAMIGGVPSLRAQASLVAALRQSGIRGYVAIGAPEHLLSATSPSLAEAANASFEGDIFSFELEVAREIAWAVLRPSMVVVATRTEFAWARVRREDCRISIWPSEGGTAAFVLTPATAGVYPIVVLDELERSWEVTPARRS